MTAATRHQAHDRLQAHVQMAEGRLDAMSGRIEDLEEQDVAAIGDRAETLATQCQDLKREIASWTEVEIGVLTSVEDLESAVDTLEADLDALMPAQSPEHELAIDRQVRAWKRRVDWLRLQGALGTMEARDDLGDLTRRLGAVRGDVLVELQNAVSDSKNVAVDVWIDVEKVLADVRRAVEKAASDLRTRRG
jgi:septal ring factor EnvC (AmiA/AmiB activator)